MKKIDIKVPRGIKYISEWSDYVLPGGHCIVDKGVTGCGYTEYCLTNDKNIVLCSPRKLLLENKSEQHQGDPNILYLRNNLENYDDVRSMEDKIRDHIIFCQDPFSKKIFPIKLLVTYDSTHYIINYLRKIGRLGDFTFVVDEMQSIFLDSYFKSDVEFDFVDYLQVCPNVLYLSATPMLDRYLDKVSEFKGLDFYKMDWSETGIVEKIVIKRKFTKTLVGECRKIIQEYKSGNFPMELTDKKEFIFSREAVFYFNSIGDIISVIKKEDLKTEEVNIICADTKENKNKLSKLSRDLGYTKKGEGFKIGRIPLKDEPNKMFTFCTKTAYIGADFYSDNASSFVFADPNISCLALDISLDLPQIVGRQRNRENPFKNSIIIFYRTIRKKEIEDRKTFDEKQNQRKKESNNLLEGFFSLTSDQQLAFVKKLKSDIKVSQYQDDFISISKKTNLPVYNQFIEIANERAWDVSQKDYQDKISVTKALEEISKTQEIFKDKLEKEVDEFLDNRFYSTGIFEKKMKMYCEFMDQHQEYNQELQDMIYFKIKDERFRKYYNYYGTSGCRAVGYFDIKLKSGMLDVSKEREIKVGILGKFEIGKSYTLKEIKFILTNLYRDLGLSKKPKATDLEDYFVLTRTRLIRDGKENGGFKIKDYK